MASPIYTFPETIQGTLYYIQLSYRTATHDGEVFPYKGSPSTRILRKNQTRSHHEASWTPSQVVQTDREIRLAWLERMPGIQ